MLSHSHPASLPLVYTYPEVYILFSPFERPSFEEGRHRDFSDDSSIYAYKMPSVNLPLHSDTSLSFPYRPIHPINTVIYDTHGSNHSGQPQQESKEHRLSHDAASSMTNVHTVSCQQQQTPICSSQAINYSTLHQFKDGSAAANDILAPSPPSTAIRYVFLCFRVRASDQQCTCVTHAAN